MRLRNPHGTAPRKLNCPGQVADGSAATTGQEAANSRDGHGEGKGRCNDVGEQQRRNGKQPATQQEESAQRRDGAGISVAATQVCMERRAAPCDEIAKIFAPPNATAVRTTNDASN